MFHSPVSDSMLADLKHEQRRLNRSANTFIYLKRDVERLCQRKFGGADGLNAERENRLEKKRKRSTTAAEKKTKLNDEVKDALKRLKVESMDNLMMHVSKDLVSELLLYASHGEGKAVSLQIIKIVC